MRHLHRYGPHILKPDLPHLLGGPLHGLIQRLRSAQAVADAITQILEPVETRVILERRFDKLAGGFAILSYRVIVRGK